MGKNYVHFKTYHWKLHTLRETFKKVGFKRVIFYKPVISMEGYKFFGKEFWKEYMKIPPLLVLFVLNRY